MSERTKKSQGMHWLRNEKRLAIYLRDGLACVYCGQAIENGIRLTLDHITPHSQGGSNDAVNLITACLLCNSSRGDRDYRQFAGQVAEYLNHGITAQRIIDNITLTIRRPLDITAAKALIIHRGGFSAALRD